MFWVISPHLKCAVIHICMIHGVETTKINESVGGDLGDSPATAQSLRVNVKQTEAAD